MDSDGFRRNSGIPVNSCGICGGIKSIDRNSKTCQENKSTKVQPPQPPQKKEKSILNFFSRNSVQRNTPRVVLPPPVHAAPLQHESIRHPESATPISDGDEVIVDDQPHPFPSALKLMRELKAGVEAIPKDVEPAPLDHPLAAFSGDPAKYVLGIVEDDWEDVLNPRMK